VVLVKSSELIKTIFIHLETGGDSFMGRRKKSIEPLSRQFPPARSVEEREKQLTLLAYDAAEQQMRSGTASAQVICYWLKQGSIREQVELEKLRKENAVLEAKRESLNSASANSELLDNMMEAFKKYSGYDPELEASDGR